MEEKITILYLDDEPGNLSAFKATFRRDYTIFIAETVLEAKKILSNNTIHIILSDQRMPETTGVEFLQSIIELYPDLIRILITGYSDVQAVIDAINKGQVYQYISKPWDKEKLKYTIEKGYEVYRLKAENKALTAQLKRVNTQLEFMLRQKLIS